MYASVLNRIHQTGIQVKQLHIHDQNFCLLGAAGSEEIKNRMLQQLHRINLEAEDVPCELTVDPSLAPLPSPKVKAYPLRSGGMPTNLARTVRCWAV
jgi:hypothetical protein